MKELFSELTLSSAEILMIVSIEFERFVQLRKFVFGGIFRIEYEGFSFEKFAVMLTNFGQSRMTNDERKMKDQIDYCCCLRRIFHWISSISIRSR